MQEKEKAASWREAVPRQTPGAVTTALRGKPCLLAAGISWRRVPCADVATLLFWVAFSAFQMLAFIARAARIWLSPSAVTP